MFQTGSIDIAQPSVTKIGGITEMRKIIALAEAHSVELVPHCAYFGPGNLASIHIVAALATDTLLENIYANLEGDPYGGAMLATGGKISVPSGPGLGVEPDIKIDREISAGPSRRDPIAAGDITAHLACSLLARRLRPSNTAPCSMSSDI